MSVLEATTENSVERLVLAAQLGDRDAFGSLAKRYERAVYAIAYRRLANHAEAQEVCQEVFVKALRKLDQLRQPECFGGWLRSIATRMSLNRAIRRTPTTAAEHGTVEASCASEETPLTVALASERRSEVRAGLGRLGALDRATLVAFYVEGQSLVEMSDQFDSPIGTIKRRLHVARKRLAKELESLVAV